MMYREKATVNAALEKAGGTKIADTTYSSSSQSLSYNYLAWVVLFDDGILSIYNKSRRYSVCGVRAF